jgi:hypothetical protein
MIGTTPPRPQRFPSPRSAAAPRGAPTAPLAALVASLLAACSGGGGGGGPGPNAAPTLVTASFAGSFATPLNGDTLLLTFSEAVAIVPGALLTDTDVELSANATLGAVSAPPVQLSANTVSVTLGPGVAIVPGGTTITLRTAAQGAPGNDVIRDVAGQLGVAGTPVAIGNSDGSAPSIGNLTIAAVDDALNGTGPAGGVLQVPANGWTIDLAYSDNSAIATAQTTIAASVPVATPAGTQTAGTNLLPLLEQLAADNTAASYRVPGTVSFPNGPFTLTAVVVDASGLGSTPATFPATVLAFNAVRQPFETNANPSQVWFLDFSRDIESLLVQTVGGTVTVTPVGGANGRSDFEDVLRVLGLTTDTPLANVESGLDSNEVVVGRYKQALLAQLALLYSGVNVTFTLTQPAGSFGSSSSVPYNALGFSRISIAGASDLEGVLGVAIFDVHNETQNDNTIVDFGGTRLGIFLHTIVRSGLGSPSTSLFRQIHDPFAPAAGGTPIGGNASDRDRLTGALTDARADAIDDAIQTFARFTAVVTAHECGHSMGLVQNGAMPVGLYGNDTTNFPGSSDGHIRNAAQFPAGSTNVMSPSLSYNATLSPSTGFNTLNRAYLREQVTYGN